ncbi:diguanylate cyclase [Leptospira perolatii]|uniref:diguanylate cyclase n=1 Tax=Leptospira perolatii TaxID=2023191 RepID=A0A2M9ZPA2_9LEPT|nr:diguanylate cyclase [Leptospira perolatii]PJZ70904.1 diguanylate cyclase [Leptospira perolatii]PJZ73799.1 diguanylate cyclase [Leptospira perolatii]
MQVRSDDGKDSQTIGAILIQSIRAGVLLIFLFSAYSLPISSESKPPVNSFQTLKLDLHSPDEIRLSNEVYYLKDSAKNLSETELISGELDSQFKKNTRKILNFGYDPSVYWLRIAIEVDESLSEERYLEIESSHLDKVDLFWKDSSSREGEFRTGDQVPFKERPVADRYFVFPLPLEDKAKITIYIKVYTEGAVNLPISLLTKEKHEESSRIALLAHGIFFGALGVMAFYNLFLFFGVREKAFLYYVLLISSVILYVFFNSGYAFWYLFPNSPNFTNKAHIILVGITMTLVIVFSAEYLQSVNYHKKLHLLLMAMIGLWAIFIVSALFIPLHFLMPVGAILPIGEILVLIAISIFRILQKDRRAQIFLIAWSLSLLGTFIYSLYLLGILDEQYFAFGSLKLGILSNVVLLSLGLVDRINTFRKEKEEAKEQAEILLELSLMDPLTGVANRRFFDQELDREWNRSVRTDRPLSMLMIDVDYFKAYNDTYGHPKGDEVLGKVAHSLQECLNRSSDMISRYGGEEFGVILPDTPVEGAIVVALNMLQTVEDMHLAHEKSPFSRVTVSIGVSSNQDRDIHSPQELLGRADKNLYDAKAFGRNHIRH